MEEKEKCPKCGANLGDVTETASGRKLQRCSKGSWNKETKKNEGCDYVKWLPFEPLPLDEKCPKCGKALVLHKITRKMTTYRYLAKWYIKTGRFEAKQHQKIKDGVYHFGIPRYILREFLESLSMLILNLFNRRSLLTYWKRIFLNTGRIIEFIRLKTCQK